MTTKLKASKQLLSRFQKVVQEWPVNPARNKERDLGTYLKNDYSRQFEKLLNKDMTKAASTVESLEKLGSNYYRTRYLRERKLGYTGDMTVNNIWLKASEEAIFTNDKDIPTTFWERFRAKFSRS